MFNLKIFIDNEDYISKVCNSSHSESCFKSKAWKWICLIFFPYISTFFSSIAVMLVRTIDGLILAKPAVGHGSNFYGPLPIIYIVLVLVCISLSYLAINAGLKYYDSVYIAPLFKIGSLLHNLFSGGILLNEFHDYSNDKVKFGIFIAGISVWIVGISLLILGYKKSGKDQLN